MQLEDYFTFLHSDDIRVKGTRIGIETILYDYIYHARSPEEIAQTYWSLSVKQVYATILYYLENKTKINQYLQGWIEHGERMREQQRQNPSPSRQRLQNLRQSQASFSSSNAS